MFMTRRAFLTSGCILAIAVLLLITLWRLRYQPYQRDDAKIAPQEIAYVEPPSPDQAAPTESPLPASALSDLPADSAPVSSGKTELVAYRIAVRNGNITLDGIEHIWGNFHARRGSLTWYPGMWCVRLLDADMKVLAEDTLRAPDATCIVLDHHHTDAEGHPQPVQYSGLAEESMLQMRLPPNPEAKWLHIYRISTTSAIDWTHDPSDQQLAAIPLP